MDDYYDNEYPEPECDEYPENDDPEFFEPDFGDGDDDFEREMFEDPGGRSALRRATPSNPRNLPCPTCGEPNRLTPEDVRLGYQCDACADEAEGFGY